MFSLNSMFLCSLIEELYVKEENDKIGCKFNFEHQCILKYAKKKFRPQAVMYSNSFVFFFTQIIRITFIKCFTYYRNVIHMYIIKFLAVSTNICFWVMLITHTYQSLKINFCTQGTSKHINPSKSQFRRFDTKRKFF